MTWSENRQLSLDIHFFRGFRDTKELGDGPTINQNSLVKVRFLKWWLHHRWFDVTKYILWKGQHHWLQLDKCSTTRQGNKQEWSEAWAKLRTLVFVSLIKQCRELLHNSEDDSRQTGCGVLQTESVVLNSTHGLLWLDTITFDKSSLWLFSKCSGNGASSPLECEMKSAACPFSIFVPFCGTPTAAQLLSLNQGLGSASGWTDFNGTTESRMVWLEESNPELGYSVSAVVSKGMESCSKAEENLPAVEVLKTIQHWARTQLNVAKEKLT